MEEIKNKFREMDERLIQAEKDLKELAKLKTHFKKTAKNIDVLLEFYHSEAWMSDREKLPSVHSEKDEYFYSSSEDGIWNVAQDFYQEKIKFLKLIASGL